MIKRVAFTMYPVSDLKRARQFYEDDLGLKPGYDVENNWVEYDAGGTCFGLYTFRLPWEQGMTRSTNLALEVDDLDQAIARLRDRKVEIKMEPMSTPVCRIAAITDPDGNILILHELKE
jgi:predicted enzyme related to lactoylglutathione lyase